MTCPKCGKDEDKVVDTYPSSVTQFRRRRKCEACGHRFSTREDVVFGEPYQRKGDEGFLHGHPLPFQRFRKDVCDARGVVVASALTIEMAESLIAYFNVGLPCRA